MFNLEKFSDVGPRTPACLWWGVMNTPRPPSLKNLLWNTALYTYGVKNAIVRISGLQCKVKRGSGGEL